MAKTKTPKLPTFEILFEDIGTIVLIRPITYKGKKWIEENVQTESWQWSGDSLASEPRMALGVAEGARNDGLVVTML